MAGVVIEPRGLDAQDILTRCSDLENGSISCVLDVSERELYISASMTHIFQELVLPGAEALIERLKAILSEFKIGRPQDFEMLGIGARSRPLYACSAVQILEAKSVQEQMATHMRTLAEMAKSMRDKKLESPSFSLGVENSTSPNTLDIVVSLGLSKDFATLELADKMIDHVNKFEDINHLKDSVISLPNPQTTTTESCPDDFDSEDESSAGDDLKELDDYYSYFIHEDKTNESEFAQTSLKIPSPMSYFSGINAPSLPLTPSLFFSNSSASREKVVNESVSDKDDSTVALSKTALDCDVDAFIKRFAATQVRL